MTLYSLPNISSYSESVKSPLQKRVLLIYISVLLAQAFSPKELLDLHSSH